MKRGGPIKRKKYPPRSSKRIRARKPDPQKRRFAKMRDPDYELWIEDQPCLICRRRPVDPAHIRPRSLGSPDRGNLVPLCRACHDAQEGRTAVFERQHGISLAALARELDARYVGQEGWAF